MIVALRARRKANKRHSRDLRRENRMCRRPFSAEVVALLCLTGVAWLAGKPCTYILRRMIARHALQFYAAHSCDILTSQDAELLLYCGLFN